MDNDQTLQQGREALAFLEQRTSGSLELIHAAKLQPEPITWLWPGYLAAGKFHVLAGAPGTGKTTIALAVAATVTRGTLWPDGCRASAGDVLIWSGEDDPRDTLVPRLMAAGADLNRVRFVGDVFSLEGRRAFDPATDAPALLVAAESLPALRLLIVDPVVSAVAGDSHKNAEVRRGLAPLVDFGQRVGAAVLGISHFTKGTSGRDPLERVTGSLAYGALARVVLGAAKKQGGDDEGTRVFLRLKSNIGPDDGGFTYTLAQREVAPGIVASTVVFGDPIQGSARDILAACDAQPEGEGGALADAVEFLQNLLADGPMPTKAIKADADGAGYAWRTIQRAQKALGIEAYKEGMKGGWHWHLSRRAPKNPEDSQQKVLASFEKVGVLRDTPPPPDDEAEAF